MSLLRTPPRLRDVALAQLRLLYKEKYPAGLTAVVLLGVALSHAIIPEDYYDRPPWVLPPVLPNQLITLMFVGLIAAGFTWVNESPSRRGYHHSLPVKHWQHDLLRVIAGLTWLVVTLSVFSIAGFLAENRVLREQWLMHAPTVWLSFFAVPLLIYMLFSIFAVAFDRMVVWVATAIVVALVADSQAAEMVLPEIRDVAQAVIWDADAPYSLGQAITGMMGTAPWEGTRDTYRVYNATADEYIKNHPEYVKPMQTRSEQARSIAEAKRFLRETEQTPPQSPERWLKALGVWFVLSAGVLALALQRRPAG
ncbi:MAG TPA: hypothetical protein VGD49_04215 [Longimicrobiales bacterium]